MAPLSSLAPFRREKADGTAGWDLKQPLDLIPRFSILERPKACASRGVTHGPVNFVVLRRISMEFGAASPAGWRSPVFPPRHPRSQECRRELRGFTFNRAFTSVLARANETLRLALETIGQTLIPIERDKALNERMYGELQGMNKAETAKKYGDDQVKIWRRASMSVHRAARA